MTTIQVKDAGGGTVFVEGTGGGSSSGDPFVPNHNLKAGATVTANIGTVAGLALDATIAAGNVLLTAIRDRLPSALGTGGGVKVDGSGTALPVSVAGVSTETTLAALNTVSGATADAIVAAGAAGTLSAKLRRVTQGLEDLKTLIVLGAGSAIIGKFGIDQTTPGTTNLVRTTTEDATNTLAPTLTKPVSSATYAPSTSNNFGAATKANVKASAGNVYAVVATNTNASVRYLQLHNKATAPAATEVPQVSIPLPAGTAAQPTVLELNSAFFAPSERFATGIGWAISTTLATFTDSATAGDHSIHMRYV